ncbi:FAD-binding oxidoreductase [Alkalihalobacillus sp. BA299]|uniref:FAD-dependent oxidoreductase n=1 Tax=Alkalihalobacillus sp. BA299 TaxID=2815938 RepID=UPI0027DB17A0|nr:FAD-binding oxidoreductase [Alkalihalobacillus sp. BA299]
MVAKLTGRIVYLNDKDYTKARENLNLFNSKFPGAIVYCEKEVDVINALAWARENNVSFRVRSGRHSYENFSVLNGGIIIDISELNKISVDLDKKIATIQAGTNLGKVYTHLWECGVTIPAGTEFSVGLAGLTLGGGIGLLSRLFGLTCDNLIGLRIVIPKGKSEAKVVDASRETNSNLFWACCGGGGGNFGIVTQFHFRVHPISIVSLFRVEWDWKHLEKAYNAWQTWAPFTDLRLTSQLELSTKSKNSIVAEGQFVGSKADLKKLIVPLVKNTKPRKIQVTTVTFIKAVKHFNNPAGNIPSFFKRSGSFVFKPLPSKAIEIIKQFLSDPPNEEATIWQQSLGGAVQQIKPTETAYFHRKAIIVQEYNTSWEKEEDASINLSWVVALRKALKPYIQGDYVNWPDVYIKNWPETYYGENYARLRKIKTEVDPFNVFRFQQSISPLP